ncbi:ATPases of the AAA+ class [uncultured Candidatus Thioglobus sp.]|nr:ATPases of the AAA+ class [uncultured Candidatus Thioglobus sp.]
MSGVGKTHLSKLLSLEGDWYHYSGDYRIGAKYLNDAILDNIKQQIRQDDYLAELLDNHSISVQNHITFDNLSSMSSFLGKVGNPELGGLPIDEFSRRQSLFQQAESKTMLDVEKFIKKSQTQGCAHFINDAGGSLCELDDDKVYQSLADNTLIVHIRANQSHEETLIERAQSHPKPLYYQRDFIQQQLAIYLQENHFIYVAQINPDAFARWVFPRLLEHRKPKYAAIADKYGCTIDAQDLHQCKNANEVMSLITEAIR